MSAIHAIIILAVFAAIIWAIITYIPMSPGIKRAIVIFAIVCAAFWILDITGVLGDAQAIKIPQIH